MRFIPHFIQPIFSPKGPQKLNILRHFCRATETDQRLRENPYFDKYSDKIAAVQLTSPEKFKTILESNLKDAHTNLPPFKKQINQKPCESGEKMSQFQRKSNLNQIMKLDVIKDKSASEIESIWNEYHRIKDGIYAVVPAQSYEKINEMWRKYPIFLFPLPRAEGYEFMMSQFLNQSCYFTSLINYQAFKENAPVSLTVTYFTELLEDKGIVLMQGEYDTNTLKAHEAQCLTNQLHLYYGSSDDEKFNLLMKFNKHPDTFKHMDLISNFESSFGK